MYTVNDAYLCFIDWDFFSLSKGGLNNLFVTVGPFIYLYVLDNEQRQLEKLEKQETAGLLTTYLKVTESQKGKSGGEGRGLLHGWIGMFDCKRGEFLFCFVLYMICCVVFWPFRIWKFLNT